MITVLDFLFLRLKIILTVKNERGNKDLLKEKNCLGERIARLDLRKDLLDKLKIEDPPEKSIWEEIENFLKETK